MAKNSKDFTEQVEEKAVSQEFTLYQELVR